MSRLIFGSLISIPQHLEGKNTICCGRVQLRCHKMVIFFFVPCIGDFLLEIGEKMVFAIGNMTQYGLSKWAKK